MSIERLAKIKLRSQMNIFIARTPYHVMLAHAVCMAECDSGSVDEYQATLIYTGMSLDAIESIISGTCWADILHFCVRDNAWTLRRSNAIGNWVEQHFAGVTVDTVHISDDMNWRDQVLEYHLGARRRYLIEDGIGSYYKAALTTRQFLFRNTVLRSLHAGKVRHFGAVSQSRAHRYFAVDPIAFPWIEDRSNVRTVQSELRRFVSGAAMQENLNPDTGAQPDLYFLTQPLYESEIFSRAQDLQQHRSLASHFPEARDVLVKKHPRELDDMFDARVAAIESALPKARVISTSNPVPAELLAIRAKKNATFVSFSSTALINIRHLRDDLVVYFHPVTIDESIATLFSRLGIRKASERTG